MVAIAYTIHFLKSLFTQKYNLQIFPYQYMKSFIFWSITCILISFNQSSTDGYFSRSQSFVIINHYYTYLFYTLINDSYVLILQIKNEIVRSLAVSFKIYKTANANTLLQGYINLCPSMIHENASFPKSSATELLMIKNKNPQNT